MFMAALLIVAGAQAPALNGVDTGPYTSDRTDFKFVENKGQWNRQALFRAHSPQMDMWVTETGIAYNWHQRIDAPDLPLVGKTQDLRKDNVVFVDFLGANSNRKSEGIHALKGTTRYIKGKRDVVARSFSSATIKDLYKGIDLVTYIDPQENQPRYDLIVHAGADPNQIKMRYRGAKHLSVDQDGHLQYAVGDAVKVSEQRQMAYQEGDHGVPHHFLPMPVIAPDQTVSFDVAGYNKNRTLVIDPLVYSTYAGGSGSPGDVLNLVATDPNGNTYLAGTTTSADFPSTAGSVPTDGDTGTMILKFDQNRANVFAVVVAGDLPIAPSGIGFDSAGDTFVAGTTQDNLLTPTNPFTKTNSTQDDFVLQLSPTGGLKYYDMINPNQAVGVTRPAIAVKADGTVTMAAGNSGPGFAVQITSNTGVVSSPFSIFGGGVDTIEGVAVDSSGEIFVAGTSSDTELTGYSGAMTTNPNDSSDNHYGVTFLSRTTPGNAAPDQETYIGGVGASTPVGLALDSGGNLVVAGEVFGASLPQTVGGGVVSIPVPYTFPTTVGAFDTAPVNNQDLGFVAKVTNDLKSITAASLYRAKQFLDLNGFALDSNDSPTITGNQGGGFTLTYDYFSGHAGPGFLVRLSSDLTAETYGTYLPGGAGTVPEAVAVDSLGRFFVAGSTQDSDFPTTIDAFQSTLPGQKDGFFTLINPTVITGLNSIHTDRGMTPTLAGGSGRAVNVTVNLVEPVGTSLTLASDTPNVVQINGAADQATETVVDASHILTFQVTANDVAAPVTVHLSVNFGGTMFTVPLTVKPFLREIVVRSNTVASGATTTLYVYPTEIPQTTQTVTISATPGGAVTTPTSVVIFGIGSGQSISGPTKATVQTGTVTSNTEVDVTATHDGISTATSAFDLLAPRH